MSFEVSKPNFDELTEAEQQSVSNNGAGKEWANYIRITRNGTTVWLENDAMEPEDARFSRDLKWILEALQYAYECGKADGGAK